jgi:hypothetical protein
VLSHYRVTNNDGSPLADTLSNQLKKFRRPLYRFCQFDRNHCRYIRYRMRSPPFCITNRIRFVIESIRLLTSFRSKSSHASISARWELLHNCVPSVVFNDNSIRKKATSYTSVEKIQKTTLELALYSTTWYWRKHEINFWCDSGAKFASM